MQIVTEYAHTDGLAGFGCMVDLVTLLTFAFVAAHLVDANLTASIRVGTLIDIWWKDK